MTILGSDATAGNALATDVVTDDARKLCCRFCVHVTTIISSASLFPIVATSVNLRATIGVCVGNLLNICSASCLTNCVPIEVWRGDYYIIEPV